MSDAPQWLTVPQAARVLGKSERQVYRLAKQGQIPTIKQRGRIFVKVSDVGAEDDKKQHDPSEVVRLKQQVKDLTEERDYLRQALALSMQNITKLLEAGEQSQTTTTEGPTPPREKPPPVDDQAGRRWSWRRWPWSK